MVFCRMITVIIWNTIRKINLNTLYQFLLGRLRFFVAFQTNAWHYQNLHFKIRFVCKWYFAESLNCDNVEHHLEVIKTLNIICRVSFVNKFCLFSIIVKGTYSALKTFILNYVPRENGILKNYYCDNFAHNWENNSEHTLPCFVSWTFTLCICVCVGPTKGTRPSFERSFVCNLVPAELLRLQCWT